MQRYGSTDAAFSVFNPAGLASPMVDAIIQASLHAESRAEEETSLRALDRALRYEFFMIPQQKFLFLLLHMSLHTHSNCGERKQRNLVTMIVYYCTRYANLYR